MNALLARWLPRFFPEKISNPCPVCGKDARRHFDRDMIDQFVAQFGFSRDGLVLTHGTESIVLKGDCWACDLRTLGAWLGKRRHMLPVTRALALSLCLALGMCATWGDDRGVAVLHFDRGALGLPEMTLFSLWF